MKPTLKVSELPPNLPASTNDGACDHLVGRKLPAVELASSTGESSTCRARATLSCRATGIRFRPRAVARRRAARSGIISTS